MKSKHIKNIVSDKSASKKSGNSAKANTLKSKNSNSSGRNHKASVSKSKAITPSAPKAEKLKNTTLSSNRRNSEKISAAKRSTSSKKIPSVEVTDKKPLRRSVKPSVVGKKQARHTDSAQIDSKMNATKKILKKPAPSKSIKSQEFKPVNPKSQAGADSEKRSMSKKFSQPVNQGLKKDTKKISVSRKPMMGSSAMKPLKPKVKREKSSVSSKSTDHTSSKSSAVSKKSLTRKTPVSSSVRRSPTPGKNKQPGGENSKNPALSPQTPRKTALLNLDKIKSRLEGSTPPEVTSMVQDDLSLVVKDPNWIFAHWYISPDTVKTLQKVYPQDRIDNARLAIYLYDFNEKDNLPREKHLLNIYYPSMGSHFHHLHVPQFFGRRVYIDLGFETEEKKFIHLSRSNLVYIPHSKYTAKHSSQYITFSHLKKHISAYDKEHLMHSNIAGPFSTEAKNLSSSGVSSPGMGSINVSSGHMASEGLASQISSGQITSGHVSSLSLSSGHIQTEKLAENHFGSHRVIESSGILHEKELKSVLSKSSFESSVSSDNIVPAMREASGSAKSDSSVFGKISAGSSSHDSVSVKYPSAGMQSLSSESLAGSSEINRNSGVQKQWGASESMFGSNAALNESSYGLSTSMLSSGSVWSAMGSYSSGMPSSFQLSSFQDSSFSSHNVADRVSLGEIQWQSEISFMGRTQFSSRVQFEGREIPVRNDGTFIIRIPEHLARKKVKIDILHADGKTEQWVGTFSGQIKPV